MRFLGVFFTEGDLWKNQRRFTLRHLRDFGFGKQKMDEYIHEEVSILFDAINRIVQKQSDHPEIGLDLLTIMPAVAINTLWYIIAGSKNDLEDEKFMHLTTLVLKFFRLGNQASPVTVYKLLQKIPIVNRSFREQEDCGDELNSFVQVLQNLLFVK
jgi:methyl farnesoate epoxidase / farnesoate epoxidase